MKIDLITRAQLERVSRRRLKYPLQAAEKDYFLTLALLIIDQSPLRTKLVFKGGTALHHHYLPQLRFSEDLDFTSLDEDIGFDEVASVLEAHDFFSIKKQFISPATIKIEKLQYSGILAQPNHIKVEIDHFQNVVLPPQRIRYHNAWELDATANVMDVREICAEKLRAMSDRARYRDFYDVYFILREIKPSFDEVIALLRQKEIRKPILKDQIFANWQQAQQFKQKDIVTIYLKEQVEDAEIWEMIQGLDFAPIYQSR